MVLKIKSKIDGQKIFDYNDKTLFVKKGDSESVSIASASILAKTFRDNLMCKYAKSYPYYNWVKTRVMEQKNILKPSKNSINLFA